MKILRGWEIRALKKLYKEYNKTKRGDVDINMGSASTKLIRWWEVRRLKKGTKIFKGFKGLLKTDLKNFFNEEEKEKVRLKEYLELQKSDNCWINRCSFCEYFFNDDCDKCWYKDECSDCLRSMEIVE